MNPFIININHMLEQEEIMKVQEETSTTAWSRTHEENIILAANNSTPC